MATGDEEKSGRSTRKKAAPKKTATAKKTASAKTSAAGAKKPAAPRKTVPRKTAAKKAVAAGTAEASPMRHEGPGGFSMTPLWVIKRCRKTVWLYDFLRARYGGLDATFPGIKAIAEEMGVSRRTVEAALNELEEQGAVTRYNRFREDGSQTSNEYVTHFYEPEERAPEEWGEAPPEE